MASPQFQKETKGLAAIVEKGKVFNSIVEAYHSFTVSDPLVAGALIMVSLTIISFYTSVGGIVKAEMFPVEVRALGVGLSYAIGNALFGGSAEYVALGLKSLGSESAFYWYVTAMMVVAALISLRLPRQPTYLRDNHATEVNGQLCVAQART